MNYTLLAISIVLVYATSFTELPTSNSLSAKMSAKLISCKNTDNIQSIFIIRVSAAPDNGQSRNLAKYNNHYLYRQSSNNYSGNCGF